MTETQPPLQQQALNPGRAMIAQAFRATFEALHGQPDVTEIGFKRAWHDSIVEHGAMSLGGWYSPPEDGLSVLVATAREPARISFKSLRDSDSSASYTPIDWNEGIILGYASHVFLPQRLPGDFATTVYLGHNPRVRQFFRDAFVAARSIAEFALTAQTPGQVFKEMERVLGGMGMLGTTYSYTDPDAQNIGHTLPLVLPGPGRRLTAPQVSVLRHDRQFMTAGADWQLGDVQQFTVEPQICKAGDKTLPKLMIHYVVDTAQGRTLLDECEQLPKLIGLI